MKFKYIGQVVSWRLCTGCGACKYTCNNKAIKLVDIQDQGIRPIADTNKCERCGQCVKVCPGIELSQGCFDTQTIPELRKVWGPVLEVWEGHACDPEIRFKGSSGGITTALALYCLEREDVAGVLHIAADEDEPLKNKTVFSRNKDDLLKACGSRYAPASPCEKLNWIEKADGKCIFIGKPCDVAALRKAQAINPVLNDKVAVAISIFCAGTPTSDGTLKIIESLSLKTNQISEFRYRGHGWPGQIMIKLKDQNKSIRQMTYERAWGEYLIHCVQFRCKICPETTGQLADISCGDPWYREKQTNEEGNSLILVRTKQGQEFIQAAIADGYVQLVKKKPSILPESQPALLKKKQSVYGRLLALRIFNIPSPVFTGFNLKDCFKSLSLFQKVYSILGTIKRIVLRKMFRPDDEKQFGS